MLSGAWAAGTALLVLIVCASAACSFLPLQGRGGDSGYGDARAAATSSADFDVFDEFLGALKVLQGVYFEPWLGTWPTAIDWTAAVTGSHVAASLSSLSLGLDLVGSARVEDYKAKENLITAYFSQVLGYYFGQNAIAIRNEAFDDILWVVLGWLEAIQFVNFHTTLYYPPDGLQTQYQGLGEDVSEILRNQTWYGNLWTPAFAHRSRIFWDISTKGWDTKLCGGGMTWNPRLEPYKNAITNELFIAASISMYIYFPGDANTSPFNNPSEPGVQDPVSAPSIEPHEHKHLEAAVAGYIWLSSSGMMNDQGLYTDGFHIPGWNNASHPNTKCSARNDMVYTYNQGVILTGQVGLWKVTGDVKYLWDGHRLIQSVINATGYDLARDRPVDNIADLKPGQLPPWRGLGRAGVLEEQCDVAGTCSQDSQTFKGIYFHHLAAFCAPLDIAFPSAASRAAEDESFQQTQADHLTACRAYLGWIHHNAQAALATKDSSGRFGMWWTVGLLNFTGVSASPSVGNPDVDGNSVDYRTYGVPRDDMWVPPPAHAGAPPYGDFDVPNQSPMGGGVGGPRRRERQGRSLEAPSAGEAAKNLSDPNTRGRGRTVETQGGGLAVLRALWEISTRTRR